MRFRSYVLVLGALFFIGASVSASAQTVYKCATRRSVTYTERPCPGRIVSTDEAPVPFKPNPRKTDVRRIEQNRVLARSMRRMPGETAAEFETRRHRARLLQEDRAECERLDTRMPVEQASLKNPDPEEVRKAEEALEASRKRFSQLRC